MESVLTLIGKIFEQAGLIGLLVFFAVIVVVVVLVALMRATGMSLISREQTVVGDRKVDGVASGIADIKTSIGVQMDKVEERMASIESDVRQRATRDEVHKLELALSRMEGRFESIDQRTTATSHAVGRIETFMYEAAMRSRGDR